MSETKHTPAPWSAQKQANGQWFVLADSGYPVCRVARWSKENDESDARRIAACVNALAGIPTDLLEHGALERFVTEAERFRLAMVELDEARGHPWPHICDRIADLSAAIAAFTKARGESI